MCFNISIVNSVDVIEQQFDAEFLIDFSLQPQKHISVVSLLKNSFFQLTKVE